MMMRIVVVLALLAQVALAQRAPDMATLDRGDGISKIGLDIGFTALKQPPSPYDAALRFELWGQYISKIGLGFYGALPLTQSIGAQPPVANATALNDLDLGALYVISGETAGVVFRAGAGIPIANDGVDPALTRFAGSLPRLTDLALATRDWYARI